MNKIEELEERCEQLEDRVEALEKTLVAIMGRSEKTVVIERHDPVIIERKEPARRSEIWLNGVPVHRGCEYPAVPDGEMFKVHGNVTWYGGQ